MSSLHLLYNYSYAGMNNTIHWQMSIIVVEKPHMYNSACTDFMTWSFWAVREFSYVVLPCHIFVIFVITVIPTELCCSSMLHLS